MKSNAWRPLLFQELNLRLPGIRILRLSLNRHTLQTSGIQPHHHAFYQCLLYLTGGGELLIQNRRGTIKPGTLVFLPPGKEHTFRRLGGRRPLCLVLEFKLDSPHKHPPRMVVLSQSQMNRIRNHLSTLGSLPSTSQKAPPIRMAAEVLQVLDILLQSTGLITPEIPRAVHPAVRSVENILSTSHGLHSRLDDVAQQAGYQKDYLNRVLKENIGLTLGQYQSHKLLEKAQTLLKSGGKIQDAAEQLGFSDQNYFARWFRHQTGMSPGAWRAQR